jgi:hypothetical protein
VRQLVATIMAPDLGRFEIQLKPYDGGWAGEANGQDFLVALYVNPRHHGNRA